MKWTQPWYLAYALVGMMMLGVAPIFIPLSVEDGGKNGPTLVGLVVAAFYAGDCWHRYWDRWPIAGESSVVYSSGPSR
ncbi:hypothetical protein [Mycetocola saprophilus]|uniref:hypothetical protein n=1 Tax=Mycetocola saprophilus TaxID=76636 RepID=UPI0004C1E3E0|nr:hypothetical protein [Mycetocola saprophilus]